MKKNMSWRDWTALRVRGRQIARWLHEGESCAEIGRRLGISRERVRQIRRALLAGTGPYGGLL